MSQFKTKILKIKACTFQMVGKNPGFVQDQPPSTPFLQYLAAPTAKSSKNAGFWRRQARFARVFNPHQRCGYRHSRGYIISILQGLEMGWRGWRRCVPVNGLKTHLKKNTFFILLRKRQAQAQARSPAQAGGLRRRMKNLKKKS